MGLYTKKTAISEQEKLQLAGLLTIARDVIREEKRLVAAVADILGEDHENGHAADAVYGSYDVAELLRKSEIVVVDVPAVKPTCDAIVEWDREGDAHRYCGQPTAAYYPAAGGGFMSLCDEHAKPHGNTVTRLTERA